MINLTINKVEDKYAPSISFAPNAEVSVKRIAIAIILLKSGSLAIDLLNEAQKFLTDKQYKECLDYLRTVKLMGDAEQSVEKEADILEEAKVPLVNNMGEE